MLLLWAALSADEGQRLAEWRQSLGGISLLSLVGWVGNFRRMRHLADTPSSRIASAAQGYVRLSGTLHALPEKPLLSKLTGTPCVWYSYTIVDDNKNSKDDAPAWRENSQSSEPFLLKDETGECIVQPDGAEVSATTRNTWTEGRYDYTEWLLLPNDAVTAIGEFSTPGPGHRDRDEVPHEDLSISERFQNLAGALSGGKRRTLPATLRRFDSDGDGQLNAAELAVADEAKQRDIEVADRKLALTEGTHMLRAPGDGRPLLISASRDADASDAYRLGARAHFVVFTVAGLIWLLL